MGFGAIAAGMGLATNGITNALDNAQRAQQREEQIHNAQETQKDIALAGTLQRQISNAKTGQDFKTAGTDAVKKAAEEAKR